MRQEFKFFGHVSELRTMLSVKNAWAQHPPRVINSVYFDDRNLSDFLDSEEGSVPRKKIRFRWYGLDKFSLRDKKGSLEIKYTFDNYRDKTVLPVNRKNPNSILSIAKTQTGIDVHPVTYVKYNRDYFVDAKGVRYTIDSNIYYGRVNFKLNVISLCKARVSILEAKMPIEMDFEKGFSSFAHKRTRYSKYCQSVHAVHQDLLRKV